MTQLTKKETKDPAPSPYSMDTALRSRTHHDPDQHEHDHKAKALKVLQVDHEELQSPGSALALQFWPEPESYNDSSSYSSSRIRAIDAVSNNTTTDPVPNRFSRGVRDFFSLAQWHELEVQALIFKYMLSGASVPSELILHIKRSLLNSTANCQHPQQYNHFQSPPMLQVGYWGMGVNMDPEPGRCRRTDGKKWRCSKDAVMGHKYCERHVHRSRHRSRKLVETATTAAASGGSSSNATTGAQSPNKDTNSQFMASSRSSLHVLSLNQSRPPDDSKLSEECLPRGYQNGLLKNSPTDAGGRVLLRHFFDDWPRSGVPKASAPHSYISIPQNDSSEFFLKLSTGNSDKPSPSPGRINMSGGDGRQLSPPPTATTNWSGWGSQPEATSMGGGGPLAEALRSSTSSNPSTNSNVTIIHN